VIDWLLRGAHAASHDCVLQATSVVQYRILALHTSEWAIVYQHVFWYQAAFW
jgi:hypothetical protein